MRGSSIHPGSGTRGGDGLGPARRRGRPLSGSPPRRWRDLAGRVRGFTLIELLLVVVIITILASLALFHVYEGKRRAQIASVRQDLKNLVSAQEAYYADNQIYAPSLASLTGMLRVSDGVQIQLDSATATGWGARGEHTATEGECRVSVSMGATGIVSCG